MKTVALKDPNSGSFTMVGLTGFGTISSDDREQYGTRVSLGNVKTSLESDMALLASQVSLGNVRVSLGNLATRVSSLETLGISGISNAVSWTNLTEINLSGEKLVNGDFSNTTDLADKFTATSIANNCYARQIVSVNGTYVQSIEIKEALASGTSSFMLDQYFSGITGRSRIRIDLNGSSDPTVSALSYGDVNDVTVTNLADNWYRISLEVTLNAGSAQIRFGALETGDEVYVRNASFKASGSSTELLTSNSSFSSVWTLNNTTIAQGSGISLDDWTVTSGTLDETKLASGIVKGDGGQVSIQQIFSQNIAQGTDLVIKVTSDDDIKFYPILSNGVVDNANSFDVLASNGYAEHTTQTIVSGFRISTVSSSREYSSVSVFQGAISGGTVQAYAGGGLEKISGTSGYNSGGFSVNYIPGNSDGYFQFQLAQNNKALRVGLVYADADYSTVSPFGLDFNATGNIDNMNPYQDNITTYAQGDWFRVRHYASSNQVHFQKRGAVYVDDTDFCLLQTCGLQPNNGHQYNHTFATVDRPLILAKQTVNGLTTGEYYRIHTVNTSSGNTRIYTLDGVQIGWMTGRGTNWEVQKESGQDYFTFLTSSTTTNGSDLYLDVAFDSVGGRINDVTIVT